MRRGIKIISVAMKDRVTRNIYDDHDHQTSIEHGSPGPDNINNTRVLLSLNWSSHSCAGPGLSRKWARRRLLYYYCARDLWGFSLVQSDHVICTLASDWSIQLNDSRCWKIFPPGRSESEVAGVRDEERSRRWVTDLSTPGCVVHIHKYLHQDGKP